jgi:ATP-dependent DNA helicase PIF1
MSRLRGESKTYYAKDGGLATGEQRQKLLDNFMAQQVVHLTVGAQVMLIKNIDETLVNGSMGIVVSFQEPFGDFGGEFSRDRPRNENVHKLQERRYADVPASELEEPPKVGVIKALAIDEARRKRPVVDFNIPGGGIRQVMIEPETWKVELPNGDIQASRTQVRLNDFYTYPSHSYPDAAVSSHLSMGDVYTQITRSDT